MYSRAQLCVRAAALFGVALLLTTLWVPVAGSAVAADGGPGESIPARDQDTDMPLVMLGASDGRLAVAASGGRVFIGRAWQFLAHHGLEYRPDGRIPTDLRGSALRWAEARPDGGPGWILHVSDIETGQDEGYPTSERLLAWTPHGWIGFGNGAIVRHRYGREDVVLLDGIVDRSALLPEVVADDDAALIWNASVSLEETTQKLYLVTGNPAGGVEVVAEYGEADGEWIEDAALTPASIVWTTVRSPTLFAGSLRRRSREGGEVTSRTLPGSATTLTATDEQVAVSGSSRVGLATSWGYVTRLWALDVRDPEAAWRRITLPTSYPGIDGLDSGTYGGMVPYGSGFAFALGGRAGGTAGVHAIGCGDAEPLARWEPASSPISDVVLNGGRVYYSQALYPTQPRVALSGLRVTTRLGARPWLELGTGARSVFGGLQARHAVGGRAPAASASGDRAVVRTAAGDGAVRFVLLDGGTVTAELPVASPRDLPVKVSGPYVLADHKVFRADQGDGEAPLLDLGAEDVRGADLYGSRVVWSTNGGAVRTRDLEGDGGAVTLLTTGAAGPVAVWGTTLAWARTDQRLTVHTLDTGAIRHVPVLSRYRVADLRVSEGTLSWSDGSGGPDGTGGREGDGELRVLDLRNPGSVPETTWLHTPAAVDDHLAAGIDDNGLVRVQILPHGMYDRYRPRLVGTLAAPAFRPLEGAWEPRFDTTKPLGRVRLTISRDGDTVRTLTGSGVSGSIRDLSWDGTTEDGSPATPGVYHWTLSAAAEDGEGTLTAVNGRGRVTGSVLLPP